MAAMELEGKTALITGGALRIGRKIALTLASCGVHIVVHYRESQKEARDLKKQIEALGPRAFLIPADFSFKKKSTLPDLQSFIRSVYELVPRVDILINNASVFYPVELEKITEEIWDENMSVNLKVPFFLARQIGLRMLQKK